MVNRNGQTQTNKFYNKHPQFLHFHNRELFIYHSKIKQLPFLFYILYYFVMNNNLQPENEDCYTY